MGCSAKNELIKITIVEFKDLKDPLRSFCYMEENSCMMEICSVILRMVSVKLVELPFPLRTKFSVIV